MTGQVKEEILTRFGELGVRVSSGAVRFRPELLRSREFISSPRTFRYLDVRNRWQTIAVPTRGLAFTWCQVPIVYLWNDDLEPCVNISWDDDRQQLLAQLELFSEVSSELFKRSGRIRQLTVSFTTQNLFCD
jgi:hypothetical protein